MHGGTTHRGGGPLLRVTEKPAIDSEPPQFVSGAGAERPSEEGALLLASSGARGSAARRPARLRSAPPIKRSRDDLSSGGGRGSNP